MLAEQIHRDLAVGLGVVDYGRGRLSAKDEEWVRAKPRWKREFAR